MTCRVSLHVTWVPTRRAPPTPVTLQSLELCRMKRNCHMTLKAPRSQSSSSGLAINHRLVRTWSKSKLPLYIAKGTVLVHTHFRRKSRSMGAGHRRGCPRTWCIQNATILLTFILKRKTLLQIAKCVRILSVVPRWGSKQVSSECWTAMFSTMRGWSRGRVESQKSHPNLSRVYKSKLSSKGSLIKRWRRRA